MKNVNEIINTLETKKSITVKIPHLWCKFTIKKWLYMGELHYCIYKGLGKGSQIAWTTSISEAITFINCNWEYKHITAKNGNKGGAHFFKGTDTMIFSIHPFIKEGFTIDK